MHLLRSQILIQKGGEKSRLKISYYLASEQKYLLNFYLPREGTSDRFFHLLQPPFIERIIRDENKTSYGISNR